MKYNSITEYYKQTFGGRVYKLALDIGATCPNRDGSKGTGGCIYCSGAGSGDYATVFTQLDFAKSKLKDKKCGKYIAYFQSFSNTYMPVSKLKDCAQEVLHDSEICGISIATRPDCISAEMLEYLTQLNNTTHLVVELGLQSVSDKTLKVIGRGHTFEHFKECFDKLKANNIKVCVHVMDGLPYETESDMLKTAQIVSSMKPHSVKIHCTYVPFGTKLHEMYERGEYKPLEMDEYIDILAKQLFILDKEIYIERLTGDGDRKTLVAPKWTLHKRYFLNMLNKYLSKNY